MVTGMLKSIMKRKDGSNSDENRTTGKKSLQFVGILNGGWVTWNLILSFNPSKNKIRVADCLEVGSNTGQGTGLTSKKQKPNSSVAFKKRAIQVPKMWTAQVAFQQIFVSPRYESTSSEEEEEGEEEDGSSSVESGEGECLDSTEEDEAALEEETSEEERNVNLDESDTDEETLRATNYSSDAVKEKYVL